MGTLLTSNRKGQQGIPSLSEFARWLWIEMQLDAPPLIQRTFIPWLHQCKEVTRLLANPWMPLYEMRGENHIGALTVAYGGLGYCKPLLQSMLFEGKPQENKAAGVFVLRPGQLDLIGESDLIIIESGRFLISKLRDESAIMLPFRVQLIVDLGGEWRQVEERFHRHIRQHMRRSLAAFQYDYVITRSEQQLASFYNEMYVPTMHLRHGDLAAIMPFQEASQLLRHGWLFLVKRDGASVCGWLGHARQNIVEYREMGVLKGDLQLMKEEVVDAMIYLAIRWAHQQGYLAFRLGDVWPFLSGGFLAKRKWGATVSVSPNQHKQIWIRIMRDTPAVQSFCRDHPCIVVDRSGTLRGLYVVDDPCKITSLELAEWRKRYTTPGLSDPIVCSLKDLMQSTHKSTIPGEALPSPGLKGRA